MIVSATKEDVAGAIVRPPRLLLGLLVSGLIFDHVLLPGWFASVASSGLPDGAANVSGAALLIAGTVLLVWSIGLFRQAATPVATVHPTRGIVTAGPYRYSRNPIYVGLMFLYCGLALLLRSPVALALALPAGLVLHFGVVLREERYLSRRFGDGYLTYRSKVRRYF